MSNIKKFQYTDKTLFSLTGAPYIGYFNIADGNAYVGKYTQSTQLINIDNTQNDIIRSDKFFNRLPTQGISLTYSLSDCVFESNEIVNNNSFNLKLAKVYSNFLDGYRACFMASSNLPFGFNNIGGVSATNAGLALVWYGYKNPSTSITPLSVLSPVLSRNSKITVMPNSIQGYKTLVITSQTSLLVYTINTDLSTFNQAFFTAYIETNNVIGSGQLTFQNIADTAKSGNNFYVADSDRKTIYAYDATSVLDQDRALSYKFNLTTSVDNIQGKFTTPQLLEASDTIIYMYDSDEKIIHYFDKKLNKINSYKNSQFFTKSAPVSLTYYKLYDQLYVLTSDYKIVILDSNANSTFVDIDISNIGQYEEARKILFSNSNSDVFYLMTNKNMYKKFVSRPYYNIGAFSFVSNVTGSNSSIYGDLLYDADTYESSNIYDDIYIYGYDQFINYREQTVFNSLLK